VIAAGALTSRIVSRSRKTSPPGRAPAAGLAAVRAHETISFRLVDECGSKQHDEHLTFKVDRHGDLERKDSHLGKLS
jgi:hypothetical protein